MLLIAQKVKWSAGFGCVHPPSVWCQLLIEIPQNDFSLSTSLLCCQKSLRTYWNCFKLKAPHTFYSKTCKRKALWETINLIKSCCQVWTKTHEAPGCFNCNSKSVVKIGTRRFCFEGWWESSIRHEHSTNTPSVKILILTVMVSFCSWHFPFCIERFAIVSCWAAAISHSRPPPRSSCHLCSPRSLFCSHPFKNYGPSSTTVHTVCVRVCLCVLAPPLSVRTSATPHRTHLAYPQSWLLPRSFTCLLSSVSLSACVHVCARVHARGNALRCGRRQTGVQPSAL